MPLAALAASVVAAHRVHAARKEQTLHFTVQPDGAAVPEAAAPPDAERCVVFGDPVRLRAALENLVTNALKFTPGGGTVTVAVAGLDDRVVFSVDDSGPGVAEDEAGGVFEPYVRGRARPTDGEESTGLGLSLVREYAEHHGATVHVEASSLGGARFVLSFVPYDQR